MPEPLAAAGADYLVQLLRAAISVPAAAYDSASGSIAGGLLRSLAARHPDEHLEPFFSWDGNAPVAYEVRCYDAAGSLVSRTPCTSAGEAIRAAGESAGRGAHLAEVVVGVDNGEQRWMFQVRDRIPVYRIPERATGTSGTPPGAAAQANRPDPGAGPSSAAGEVVDTVRQMLGGMTVQVDATAIEEVVHEAVDALRRDLDSAGAGIPASNVTQGGVDVEQMARAVAVHVATLLPSAAEIAHMVAQRMASGPDDDRFVIPADFEPLDPAAQDALAAEGGSVVVDPTIPGRQDLPPARTGGRDGGTAPAPAP